MIDVFVQLAIALTGMVAIWITQQPNQSWHKYAPILGLASQPFWFYATYAAEQWGMFVLCFGYTYAWYIGFRRHWIWVK